MNRYIASFLLVGIIVGCSETESPKEISPDSIRKEVLIAVNKALEDRKSDTEHVATKTDSCSLKMAGTGVSPKEVRIDCRDAGASTISIVIDRLIGYGAIYNVTYQNGKFDTNTGCIDWHMPSGIKINDCSDMQPKVGISAQTQYGSNFL